MLIWAIKKTFMVARQSIILSLLFYVSLLISLLVFYVFYNWYLPRPRYERLVDFELQNTVYMHKNAEVLHSELVAHVNLFDRIGESFHYGQEYTISLVMDVPESENNFQIGMFGISLDVIDAEGRKSVTYKTMGTLNYKSTLLQYLTTLVYFPFYLLGQLDQKQTLRLIIKDNYIDNAVKLILSFFLN